MLPAGPSPDAPGPWPADQIRLAGLRVRGFHGVFEHERRDGQDFLVDAVLHVDARRAGRSDRLADTVHYGELAEAVAAVVRGEPVDLIEALAARIAAVCLADERVLATEVTVHKPQAPITEQFADVAVTVRRTRADLVLATRPPTPVRAVIALGGNLGDPFATLRSALAALAAVPGVTVRRASPVVRTAPVGGVPQPDYLNAVAELETGLSPWELLDSCHQIEAAHGRIREVRWGARTLDLDVITFGTVRAAAPGLELPHPRAHERAFVLAPWARLDPDAELPTPAGGRRVADLLARAADGDDVRDCPELGPLQPEAGR